MPRCPACSAEVSETSLIGALFISSVIGNATLTWDFQQWYAGSGLVILIGVLVLAGWAFYTALAGRQLFGDSLLD